MRIPGFAMRTPVTFIPRAESRGDGPIDGTPKTVKGQVATKQAMVNDATGKTLTRWTVVRIRPTVRIGSPKRAPAAGDQVKVNGLTREILAVEAVTSPGSAVAYLECTAADSAGTQTVTGNG